MTRYVRAAVLLMWSVFGLGAAASAQTAPACDRACLRAALDRYLAAVIAHDPGAARLAIGFRQTENAVNVRPGSGVWKTVTGLGKMQRRYMDPVSGQAAYYGLVDEGATSAVVTVRVRVEEGQLTEAEWYLARPGDPGLNGPAQPGRPPANLFNPEYLIANPPPERVVPPAQRLPRRTLIAIVNSYFDGITSHDGSVILSHPGCTRIENGTMVTRRRGGAGDDCAANLANFNLSVVAARRFPVVDEEAGVVLATAVFVRRPGSPTPRNVFSEWFYIDEAKIRSIYTAMFYPAPELPVPNWPPYDGNFPLPAGIVPPAPAPAPAPAAGQN